MENQRSVVLLVLLCLVGVILKCVQGDDDEKEQNHYYEEVFSPTKEWKPLKRGNYVSVSFKCKLGNCFKM